jgi:NAD(P)-dependent dehydrogenase (short-subunit alcohol dehydrogenase family)
MSKTILITGASSGIGKVTAKYFQEKGWNVVATMRNPEKETELTQLDNVLLTRLDVQDSASIQNAVSEGIARFGKIDVLLNNAGYGAYGVLEATPNTVRFVRPHPAVASGSPLSCLAKPSGNPTSASRSQAWERRFYSGVSPE